MSKDEALRLALESLCCVRDMVKHPDNLEYIDHQVAKFEAALEAKDEPVAWRYDQAKYRTNDLRGRQWAFNVFSQAKPYMDEMVQNVTPLYTTPAQRKPLTDEEINALVREASRGSAIRRDGSTSLRIARAIEAAHGIKGKA
jgi:hypothetical protein